MKFYAYIPDKDGKEPMGSEHRMIFELKTIRGAIRRSERLYSSYFKLFRFSNFYDEKTFVEIPQRRCLHVSNP